MLNEDAKPRYWTGAYDRWHLLLPLFLGLLLAWLFFFPGSAPRPTVGTPVELISAPVVEQPQPRRVSPTSLQSPHSGAVYFVGRVADAEGIAEPHSLVRLSLGTKVLSEARADSDGRYRFRLVNFSPGQYRIRTDAWVGNQWIPSPEVVFTVAPEGKPTPKSAPRRPSTSGKPAVKKQR